MNLADRDILELNELCNAIVDGNASEVQRQRLESWLMTSDDARRDDVMTMHLSASLAHQAGEMQMEPPDAPRRTFRFPRGARRAG